MFCELLRVVIIKMMETIKGESINRQSSILPNNKSPQAENFL